MSRLFNNILLKSNKNLLNNIRSSLKCNFKNNVKPFSAFPSSSSSSSILNINSFNSKGLQQYTTLNNNNQPPPPNSENNNNNNNKNNSNNSNNKNEEQEKKKKILQEKNKTIGMYVLITIIGVLGLSYAAVPLYRIFCRATGYGGTIREAEDFDPTKKRDLNRELYPIKVSFTASTANKIPWTFKPTQNTIECLPGEPVLCFYRATNNTDTPIIGVATYNITPMKAGTYFTKIQCFCFDEQRINANETIDMPVLFVIEPEMLDDKNMKNITDITLSYTFFKSNDQGELEEI